VSEVVGYFIERVPRLRGAADPMKPIALPPATFLALVRA
jgi:hypothetical protein